MIKFEILFLLFLVSFYLNAETMYIHKTDGTVDEIEITSDVNITFSDVSENERMKIFKTDNSIDEYNLTDVFVVSFLSTTIHGIEETKLKETSISLLENYPNPFNPSTNISFNIEKAGIVTVTIYNQKGEFINELMKEELSIGSYKLVWDGKIKL